MMVESGLEKKYFDIPYASSGVQACQANFWADLFPLQFIDPVNARPSWVHFLKNLLQKESLKKLI